MFKLFKHRARVVLAFSKALKWLLDVVGSYYLMLLKVALLKPMEALPLASKTVISPLIRRISAYSISDAV